MRPTRRWQAGLGAAALLVASSIAGHGAAQSPDCDSRAAGHALDGCTLGKDGRLRDPRAQYAQRLDEREAHPLVALGWEALVLGAGVLWYWIDDRNIVDWDYPTWGQRFSKEGWRLDNNEFPINFIGHPLNGAAFYAVPRALGHDPYVSTLFSVGTSFVWEFLLEFYEKVSINDMLVTPVAGIPIGEFAAKLWRYVNGVPAEPTAAQQAVAGVLGLPSFLHGLADDAPPPVDASYDNLGLDAAMGHHFEVGYRLALHDFGALALTHGVRMGGRFSSIPGEGEPGRFALFFYDADISSLWLSAGIGAGAREVELLTETYLLGAYEQAFDTRSDGHSVVVGLPVAYHFRFQDFRGWNDRLGILHLPGLGADFQVRAGALAFGSHARLHGDFAGIHSAAYSAWAADTLRAGDRTKSILTKHGYYYAWGVATRVGSELRIGSFDASAQLTLGTYDSLEGLDRSQEELTVDPQGYDRLLELEASVGLTVPSTPVRIAVGSVSTERRSRLEHRTVTREMQTWTLFGGFAF